MPSPLGLLVQYLVSLLLVSLLSSLLTGGRSLKCLYWVNLLLKGLWKLLKLQQVLQAVTVLYKMLTTLLIFLVPLSVQLLFGFSAEFLLNQLTKINDRINIHPITYARIGNAIELFSHFCPFQFKLGSILPFMCNYNMCKGTRIVLFKCQQSHETY